MPANQVSSPSTSSKDDSTREKRIATVAWRWNRQYRYDAEFRGRGFSDEEIREGDALGQAMADEYYANRCYYGDPAYGSWPAEAKRPIKDKVLAMLRGEVSTEDGIPHLPRIHGAVLIPGIPEAA